MGRTEVVHNSTEPLTSLVARAIERAVSDAGLDLVDVDGLSGYPGGAPSIADLREMLGLELRWVDGGSEGAAHLRPLVAAILAIEAGVTDHAVVFRGVHRLHGSWSEAPAGGVRADLDLLAQARITSAVPYFALRAARLEHEFGIGRRERGSIVLAARSAGADNPAALLREQMTRAEYDAAPPLSTPLTRLDCDRLCVGAVAVVVSRATEVRIPDRAVAPLAWSSPMRSSASMFHADRPAMWDCATDLWRATRLTPRDVGVWCLYDGFSSLAAEWLLALGAVPAHEIRSLLAEPDALSVGGRIPLNPDGGMLAGGRLHGLNYVHEACVQLRGDAGARQVRPRPTAGIVAVGGGPIAASLLLAAPGEHRTRQKGTA